MAFKHIFAFLFVMLFATACNGNFQLSFDENYSYLTVTMAEDDVESLIETLLTSGGSRLQNANADLRSGSIYVTADARTGNGIQSGNLTVTIGTQNGLLDVQVSSFNFGAYTAQQAGIDDFNQRLADRIALNARNRESNSQFTNVTITNTGLSFTVRTPRQN